MKRLAIIIILLSGALSYGQALTRYQRHGKLPTAEVMAIDTTRADIIYTAHDITAGFEVINRRDGEGWVPRFEGASYTAGTNIDINGNVISLDAAAQDGIALGLTALQEETDPLFTAWGYDWTNITNKPTIPTLPIAQSDVTGLVADLAGKQSTLVSGTNIKTFGGESILGFGDFDVDDFIADGTLPWWKIQGGGALINSLLGFNSTTGEIRTYNPTGIVSLIDFSVGDDSWRTGGGGSGDALTANPLSQFAATTSAQLAGVLSDETGSGGGFVRATSPTLTTPALGTPSALVLTNATGLTSAGIVDGTIVNSDVSASAAINLTKTLNTPSGGISANTGQEAINELDAETVKLTGTQTIAGQKTFSNPLGANALFSTTQTVFSNSNSLTTAYTEIGGLTYSSPGATGTEAIRGLRFMRNDIQYFNGTTYVSLISGGGSADGLGSDGDKGDITVGGTGTTLTIDNLSVTTGKIGLDAVTGDQIAATTIQREHIDTGAIGTDELGNLAVTRIKLDSDAVGTAQIEDGQVGLADLAATLATQHNNQKNRLSHTVSIAGDIVVTAANRAGQSGTEDGRSVLNITTGSGDHQIKIADITSGAVDNFGFKNLGTGTIDYIPDTDVTFVGNPANQGAHNAFTVTGWGGATFLEISDGNFVVDCEGCTWYAYTPEYSPDNLYVEASAVNADNYSASTYGSFASYSSSSQVTSFSSDNSGNSLQSILMRVPATNANSFVGFDVVLTGLPVSTLLNFRFNYKYPQAGDLRISQTGGSGSESIITTASVPTFTQYTKAFTTSASGTITIKWRPSYNITATLKDFYITDFEVLIP